MHALPNRSTRPPVCAAVRLAWGALAAACVTLAPSGAHAQDAPPANANGAPDGIMIDGSGFAGIALPIEAVDGHVKFSARRAWVWQVPGAEGSTRRLVLDGDVEALLGTYRFNATRASVWLDKVEGRGERVYQLYAVFENVSTPGADASIALDAERLPVQGVIRALEPISLRVDLRTDGPPRDEDLMAFELDARGVFAQRLAEIAGLAEPMPVAPAPTIAEVPQLTPLPRHSAPADRDALDRPARRVLAESDAGGLTGRAAPLFVAQGTFSFSVGDRVVIRRGDERNAALLSGGVAVQYTDPRTGRALELASERGVVFFQPGALVDQLASLGAESVEGIYLEGEVLASDGTYTLRGPRVYYDVPTGKAIVLDAVFWTYERRLGMPLYVRADAVRQEAAGTFVADEARLANTAFFSPHFTIGASDVTVTVYEEDVNDDRLGGRSHVDARNLKVQGGGVPFLWFPLYKGDPEQFPLRRIAVSDSNRRGFGVQSTWNAYSLLGLEPPPGVRADLLLDWYDDSGIGIGLDAEWDRERSFGELSAYILPSDDGSDVTPDGGDRNADSDTRGFISLRHLQRLGGDWTLRAEGGYVSDPLFLDSFYPRLAREGPEITNRLFLDRTRARSSLYFDLKVQANDFIAQEWLLQSPGYFVDKLPQIGYVSLAKDLLPERAPGVLTHTWEASLGLMRQRFSEVTAAEYGFDGVGNAGRAFGTLPSQSLGDFFRGLGQNEDLVTRFDTRHEISAQLNAGPLQVTPFVVGRITAYDTDFADFSPEETDSTRFWGAAGVKVATQIQRVNHSVESRLLDLHQTRHIIEPSVTVWNAGTNIDREDLPVYDDAVESIAEGTMVRVGLDQTWQTKRGGVGRWRSVDVLKLNAEYVWSSDDVDRESPIGRWYDARPELGNPGEFAGLEAVWQASEVVALAGEMIYDVDARRLSRWSSGVLFEHTPTFRTAMELRSIDSQDATYGFLTADYTLTKKYTVDTRVTYNFDEEDFQTVSARLFRAFPNGSLGLTLVYDNIRGETSFGFVFRPFGVRGGGGGLTGSDRFGFGG